MSAFETLNVVFQCDGCGVKADVSTTMDQKRPLPSGWRAFYPGNHACSLECAKVIAIRETEAEWAEQAEPVPA